MKATKDHKNVKSCVIKVPKAFRKKKYKKLLKVAINHEKNEALFDQNHPEYIKNRLGHGYALLQEKRDLKKVHLSEKTFRKQIRELGYKP
jgi:hypothetical protein